ncbi:hypothetical protein [Kineococcus arenarius]|uniref:hypothetical protein n=1 Tax=Kineococcus sp. SYSU DK007 TaxID=3383128 RepID=UPI003D7D171B
MVLHLDRVAAGSRQVQLHHLGLLDPSRRDFVAVALDDRGSADTTNIGSRR